MIHWFSHSVYRSFIYALFILLPEKVKIHAKTGAIILYINRRITCITCYVNTICNKIIIFIFNDLNKTIFSLLFNSVIQFSYSVSSSIL